MDDSAVHAKDNQIRINLGPAPLPVPDPKQASDRARVKVNRFSGIVYIYNHHTLMLFICSVITNFFYESWQPRLDNSEWGKCLFRDLGPKIQ